jgi:hypothetical protein
MKRISYMLEALTLFLGMYRYHLRYAQNLTIAAFACDSLPLIRSHFSYSLDIFVKEQSCHPNDSVCHATTINSFPFESNGTTINATGEVLGNPPGIATCNNYGFSSPSVWYDMIGNGNCYIATASARDYTPRVSVYGSVAVNGTEPCSNITCVGERTKLDSEFRGTRVHFQTTADEPYFLRVGGDYTGIRGKFQFAVDVATCPSNSSMATKQADPISSLSAQVQGDLVNATSEG